MPRIVQDSDDDGDFASTSHSPADPASPVQLARGERVVSEGNASSSTNRTSSTGKASASGTTLPTNSGELTAPELLRRQIQDAQRDLVGSMSSSNKRPPTTEPHALTSSDSLAAARSKRRKTTGELSHESSVDRIERRKSAQTYGSSHQPASSGKLGALAQSNGSDQHNGSNWGDAIVRSYTPDVEPPEPSIDASLGPTPSWGLPTSLADDFAIHEPLAMFPEQSSTIPDNSPTQQRLVHEAMLANAPAPPVVNQVCDAKESSSSSIPWSAYIDTQSVRRCVARWSTIYLLALQADAQSTKNAEAAGSSFPLPDPEPTNQGSFASSASKRSRSSKRETQPEAAASLHSDELIVGLPKEQYKPRPSRSRSAKLLDEPVDYSIDPEKTAKSRSKRRRTVDASFDQSALTQAEKIESMKSMGFSPSQAKTALKQSKGSIDAAVEWLLNNPAPGTQDLSAGSIVVEDKPSSKGAAHQAKTQKTGPGAEASGEQAESGAVGHAESVAQHIDGDITSPNSRRLARVEILNPNVKSKRGDMKTSFVASKDGGKSTVEDVEFTEVASVTGTRQSTREASIKSDAKSTGKATRRSSKRTSLVREEDHDELGDDETPPSLPAAKRTESLKETRLEEGEPIEQLSVPKQPAQTKRGRGRSRRNPPAEVKRDDEATEQSPAPSKVSEATKISSDKALQEVDANTTALKKGTPAPATEPGDPSPNTPPDTPPAKSAASVSPTRPDEKGVVQTPQTAAAAAADSKSASAPSTSKARYRVGLSRAARIPSLLRVVKK